MTDFKHLIPYNTGYAPMPMPEYGRNIQNLVDHCVQIEDREERTQCANAIAQIMLSLTPSSEDMENRLKKIWDHINIMARFELDIDFPFEVITAETINPKPEKLPYSSSSMRGRHYGRNIEMMISTVADMEEGPERDQLIVMIANHMKKLMLMHNKEGVSDAKILKDLAIYSNGKFDLDPEVFHLHVFKQQQPPQRNQKVQRKRKQKANQ